MFFTPNLVIGLTVMAVGTVLLLDVLGVRDLSQTMKYWPALIVLFGASLVAQAFRPVDPADSKRPQSGGVPCFFLFLLGVALFWTFGLPGGIESAAGRRVSATGVMGKSETNATGDVRTARLAALMGRSSLDLRQVQLAPGEELVVDVFVTMGRASIRIPDHWTVDFSALPVMGSIDEERFIPFKYSPQGTLETSDEAEPTETPDPDSPGEQRGDATAPRAEATVPPPPSTGPPTSTGPPPRLRLRGFVMMGKVEVTS